MVIEGLDPETLASYAGYCAWTLARAHAGAGDRLAIAGYLGSKDGFEQAVADFAAGYADLNDQDYVRLQQAVAAGTIVAQSGV